MILHFNIYDTKEATWRHFKMSQHICMTWSTYKCTTKEAARNMKWKFYFDVSNYPEKNEVQYPATVNPRDKDKINNKVKIGKWAHAMTYANPKKRVRSGARGVSISCPLTTPITHTMFSWCKLWIIQIWCQWW